MAARKPKVTVDWIVTTTGLGSEAGADPMGVHICGISQQCVENILLGQNSRTSH